MKQPSMVDISELAIVCIFQGKMFPSVLLPSKSFVYRTANVASKKIQRGETILPQIITYVDGPGG